MLRRLILLLFILTNLTTQVSAAYSCQMMGDTSVILKHCCCHPERVASACKDTSSGKGCCHLADVVASADDHAGSLQAAMKLPDHKPQPLPPALLPVLKSVAIPSETHKVIWEEARDHSLYGTDLFLRTQRLRL